MILTSFRRLKPILYGLFSFAVIFGIWEVAVATGALNHFLFLCHQILLAALRTNLCRASFPAMPG